MFRCSEICMEKAKNRRKQHRVWLRSQIKKYVWLQSLHRELDITSVKAVLFIFIYGFFRWFTSDARSVWHHSLQLLKKSLKAQFLNVKISCTKWLYLPTITTTWQTSFVQSVIMPNLNQLNVSALKWMEVTAASLEQVSLFSCIMVAAWICIIQAAIHMAEKFINYIY